MHTPNSPAVPAGTMAEGLRWAQATLKNCVLCGSGKIVVIGAFLPDEPRVWFPNVRPGFQRVRWYLLCRPCLTKNLKAKGALVEDKFLTMIAAERAEKGQTVQ